MASERLQKLLAAAGVASRRKAEELISSGRVSVNGNVVTELGSKADLQTDDIRVDGRQITGPERHLYIMLYKPREFVTTVSDPEGRATVMDLVRDIRERIFPVGRLDYHSEGLLLLTNDGDLMQQLTATSSHVPKTYLVKVSGHPSEEELQRLRDGIKLPAEPSMTKGRGRKRPGEGRRSFAVRTLPAKVQIVRQGDNPWYEITLTEGRNRQIRRMFEEIGHHVEKIKRVRYGPLELNVEPGKWRVLTPAEVGKLRASLTRPAAATSARTAEGDERHIQKLAERVIGKTKATRPAGKDWKRKRDWTERPPREGFAKRPPREGFAKREGASTGERQPREGGFRPRREGEFAKRKGGFQKREGGFARGPKREGGFSKREGGLQKRENGFVRGPKREGGFEKREGGFSRTPRREGGSERREGGFARGPKAAGGFKGPKREGGFSRGPRRAGGPGAPKRPGGFGKGPRQGGGPRRGRG